MSGDVELASLGLSLDATQFVEGAKTLDDFTEAGARAETQANKNSAANKAWQQNMAGVQASLTQQSQASVELSDKVQRLLDRYDPLGTKLRSLQSDFALLRREMGNDSSEATLKAFSGVEAEIEKTKQLMGQAGVAGYEAFSKVADGADATGHATAGATRELIVMGREVVSGNFSRLPGSMLVMASRMGLTLNLLSPLTLGFVAAGAGVAAFTAAAIEGGNEQKEMQHALELTGNFAGMTQDSMRNLAAEMSRTSTLTITASKSVVTELVASGKLGASSLAGIAKLAGDYAAQTGTDADKVAGELGKIFDDPAKGAEHLNETMHLLSVADQEYINHLVRMGQEEEARLVLLDKLRSEVPKQVDSLGFLQKAWISIGKAASEAWDSMEGLGRKATTQDLLDSAIKRLRTNSENGAGASQDSEDTIKKIAALRQQLEQEKFIATVNAAISEEKHEQVKAQTEIDKSASYHLTELRDALTLVKEEGVASVDKNQRIMELNKQIGDAERALGKDSRDLLNAKVEGQEKLYEVSIDLAEKMNDADLKEGRVTQQNHDATKAFLDLYKNAVEQNAVKETQALGGLNALEKERLGYKLAQLQAQAQAIALAGDAANSVDDAAALKKIEDEMGKYAAARIKELDDQIKKQQEHNAEIGKTKEQIERVRTAQLDAETVSMEADAEAVSGLLERKDITTEVRAIYTAYLGDLQIEIDRRRTLSGLTGDAAVLQAQADSTRQLTQDFKHFTDGAERDIESALVDGGSKGGKTLIQKLEDDFKRVVFKVAIQGVMNSISNATNGFFSGNSGGSGGGGSSSGGGGGGFSFSSLSNFAADLPSFSTAVGNLGTIIPTFTAAMNSGAGFATSVSTAFSGMSSSFAAVAPYAGALVQLASGDAKGAAFTAAGAAIGSIIPGVGTVIGSVVGSLVGSLFSSKGADPHNNPQYNGLSLSLGQDGVGGSGGKGPYSFVAGPTSGKGWWADNTGLTADQTSAIDSQIAAIFAQGASVAKVLGADPSILKGVSVDSATDGTAHAGLINSFASVDAAFAALSEKIAITLLPDIANFKQGTETLAQTITRIVGDIQGFDAITQHLGMTLKLSGDASTRAASVENIISAGGGSQAFSSNLQGFYDQFYSDTEKLTNSQKDLDAAFGALGVAVPTTKDDFRTLVTGLDLTSTAGQVLFGQLVALAPAFSQVKAAEAQQAQAAAELEKQRSDLQIQLLDAQGNASAALALKRQEELAAMDASLRPLQASIYAAQDQAAAAQAQAQAEAALTQQIEAGANGFKSYLDTLTQGQQRIAEAGAAADAHNREQLSLWAGQQEQAAFAAQRLDEAREQAVAAGDEAEAWRIAQLAVENAAESAKVAAAAFEEWKQEQIALALPLEGAAGNMRTFATEVQKFLNQLKQSDLSALTPEEKYKQAAAMIAADAKKGTVSTADAQTYLEALKGEFGLGTSGYAKGYDYITKLLSTEVANLNSKANYVDDNMQSLMAGRAPTGKDIKNIPLSSIVAPDSKPDAGTAAALKRQVELHMQTIAILQAQITQQGAIASKTHILLDQLIGTTGKGAAAAQRGTVEHG